MRRTSTSLYFCQLIFVLGVALLLVTAGRSTETSLDYNADVAVEEVGRLFNLLFPLVLPDKKPHSWRSSDPKSRSRHLRVGLATSRLPTSNDPSTGSSLSLPKRAESECLRRCVGQGKLHPVQCLTLC